MKIVIEKDERYPDYSIGYPGPDEIGIEIDDAKIKEWNVAYERFEEIQTEMEIVYRKLQSLIRYQRPLEVMVLTEEQKQDA
jgi:hypothetical protein